MQAEVEHERVAVGGRIVRRWGEEALVQDSAEGRQSRGIDEVPQRRFVVDALVRIGLVATPAGAQGGLPGHLVLRVAAQQQDGGQLLSGASGVPSRYPRHQSSHSMFRGMSGGPATGMSTLHGWRRN